MQERRTGNSLSCASTEAAEHYQDAVDRILGSQAGVAEELDAALRIQPDFMLALATRFIVAKEAGEANAHDYRERAMASYDVATSWERQHVEVLFGFADDPSAHVDAARAHIRDYPGDLLLISQLAGYLFFYGGSSKQKLVLELLESVESALANDWAHLCRLGFAASEIGDRDRGRELIERALDLRPAALYAIHGLAHVLHDGNEPDKSAELLRSWLSAHEQEARGGQMYGHVQWHLALAEWHTGKLEDSRERYRNFSAPDTTTCGPVLSLADCGGFLLRDYLANGRTTKLDGAVRDLIRSVWPMIHHPFVALHVAGLYVCAGDRAGIDKCVEAVERAPASPNRETASVLVGALRCFSAGDYSSASALLAALLAERRVGIGGSNVEREVIELLEHASNERRP